ncbi:MAG TPA: carboxylesterase family protein [Prolixibacteraceae bacterium]|nr:carboxylesterase family protein [Prolixibacteraceae bacterium]
MSTSYINRREFLQWTSLSVMSSLVLFDRAWAQNPKFVVADTSFGKVRGMESRGIKIFKGIPYGASTGGNKRFMPPVDPEGWSGIRDTMAYGHSAPQNVPKRAEDTSRKTEKPKSPPPLAAPAGPSIYKALGVPGDKPTGEGEDCLVLNVWTPAINDGGKRPVMLWLHGGGFRGGSGSNLGWDGTNLCLRGDVVVLTINHRLNVMGFANLSAFSSDFAASGQVGMLDIVHALKWVQTNIAQFGGDPNRVMIFGQSGGGRKCETLLAMPSAKGLFHRAVIESGIAIKVVDRDQAFRNAEMLHAKLGISKVEVHQLQKLPVEQILEAHYEVNRGLGADLDTLGFAPSVDGVILPQHPFHPVALRVSPDVPMMIGSTRTEWTGLTTDASLWHLDEAGLQVQVNKLLGDKAGEMIELYRKCNPGASPSDLFFLIASDYSYGAKTMKISERRAAIGRGAVCLYYFAWESPVQGGMLKSPHNIEWPFAFDNTQICANLTGGDPDAMVLADKISDTWIAFARTGDPNNPKIPHWPEFDVNKRGTMIIEKECAFMNDPLREHRIAMFQAMDLS